MSKIITISIVIAIVLGAKIGFADSSDVPLPYKPSQHQIVVLAAEVYGAPLEEIMNTGHCESGNKIHYFEQSAIGAEGEIGAFQFKQDTWNRMSMIMGEKLDIHSFSDQVKLISWVFKNHPEWKSQWTTWRTWYGEGKHRCRT